MVATLVMSVMILVLPYLPIPETVKTPAFWPRYVQVTGIATLVVALLVVGQGSPVASQAGLELSAQTASWLSWLLVALLAVFALSLLPLLRANVVASAVLSGVLVNLAAIGKRYLIVVPSQTHGSLLTYPTGSYSPTWVSSTVSSWACSLWAPCSISFS